jgi:hypothetical protein
VLALLFAHDRVRTNGVVEKCAVVIHLMLVTAVAAIGTAERWRPVVLWVVVVMVLWLLVTFYAPAFLYFTKQTTGLGAANGFPFATMAYSFVMGFAVLGIAFGPDPQAAPDSLAVAGLAIGLLVLGFIAMLLFGVLAHIPEPPEPPAPPRPQPVGTARAAGAAPARSSTPPAEPTPTRKTHYTNADAHSAMSRASCSACRSTGYDVETHVRSSPHSWYLGRCWRCGDHRDFYFPTDD